MRKLELASALKIPFVIENGYQPNLKAKGIFIMSQVKDDSSLAAHTRWQCKYHIVFITDIFLGIDSFV